MKNNHIPVMLTEVMSYIPIDKKINVIDATFGGGGYSKIILEKLFTEILTLIESNLISRFHIKIQRKI